MCFITPILLGGIVFLGAMQRLGVRSCPKTHLISPSCCQFIRVRWVITRETPSQERGRSMG